VTHDGPMCEVGVGDVVLVLFFHIPFFFPASHSCSFFISFGFYFLSSFFLFFLIFSPPPFFFNLSIFYSI